MGFFMGFSSLQKCVFLLCSLFELLQLRFNLNWKAIGPFFWIKNRRTNALLTLCQEFLLVAEQFQQQSLVHLVDTYISSKGFWFWVLVSLWHFLYIASQYSHLSKLFKPILSPCLQELSLPSIFERKDYLLKHHKKIFFINKWHLKHLTVCF